MKGSSRRAVMYKLASSVTVSGGVTDDANLYITALRLDPTTKRLKVDATIGGTEAEDSAHASGDSGVFVLSVRQDTATQLAGTDGDYAPLITDANGRLHVLDANTAAIKTAVELIDNAISGSAMQVDVITMPTTTVTATNLDIRDLTSTDVVTVTGGAGQTADVKVTLDSESVAVTGTFWQATQPVSIAATVGVDVSDEATRLLGVVYGSQGAQLQQKVTSNDLIVTLDSESVAVTGTFWQTTQPVSLASVPSHDVTNAGTFATQATLQTGSAAIGKLAANSCIDIGDVDVTSIIPGTGATNLGKAIDTVTGATDTGVLALATRDDALSALTPIEGDNVQLRVDANGALWVRDDALDAALAGSELQVDIVGSLPAGTAAIGKLAANSGVDIGDVDILSIAAGDNNIGNVDIVTVPADPFGANADVASATGSISAKLRFIASTGIPITGTVTVGSHAVTNAGTFVVQEDGASLTALQLIDDAIYADNAAWTDDVSKFALVGGLYQSLPQTITDGRVAPLLLDANGKFVVA